MKDLPPFKPRKHEDVVAFISRLFINEKSADSHYIDLLDYEDGHFRVLFKPSYFVLQDGEIEPTKSQWNSLKKKLKRDSVWTSPGAVAMGKPVRGSVPQAALMQ